MADDKYVVFKKEKFDFWAKVGDLPIDETIMVRDAVVIRHQDLFAEHGLRAYAGAVITAIDIINEIGVDVETEDGTSATHHLQKLADYFNDQADLARDATSKIPD